jgi:mannosyltransferase OCH1-like enzyme
VHSKQADISTDREPFSMTDIPRIIHQTWRNQDVPQYLRRFQASWLENHPDWQYRLWTDQANRQLISDYYPEFLSVYDAYLLPIQCADAIRYFILHHFGGLYVDLDFECLRPLDPTFNGRICVFGSEPRAHALAYGMPIIIGNAIMASVPGHPLWPTVHEALVQRRNVLDRWGCPDVLRSTGPLMLTDVVQRFSTESVTVYPPEIFYPQMDVSNRHIFALWAEDASAEQSLYAGELRNGIMRSDSYAVHHWAGTWTSSREVKKALIEELTQSM